MSSLKSYLVANLTDLIIPNQPDQFPYKIVEVNHLDKDIKILIVKVKDGVYKAMDPFCPHQGYPLKLGKIVDIEDFGIVFGQAIKCPAHFWCFGLDDGQCDRTPHKLKLYSIRCEDNNIFIDLPLPQN